MNEKLNQALNKTTGTLNELKKQVKENWRIILVAAIILAISLNSFQNEKEARQNNEPRPPAPAEQNNTNNFENAASANNPANAEEKTLENTSTSNNADKNDITQTAQRGEGMTHLARRAVKGYLEQNGKTLTSEQKIYAEDYIRKNTPTQKLKTGQNITFSKAVVKTAVEKSEKLTERQIKNLGKFVPLVKNL